MIAPYRPGEAGFLRPEVPAVCPFAEAGDACAVGVHHWRERRTGPRHPLMVARCAVHEVAFTVYPPGHVPYGQRALVAVGPDGSAVRDGDASATLLEAARDAADGRAWERSIPTWSDADPDPDLDLPGWWSTQRRHLDLALRLTGVDPELDDRAREARCGALDVDTLVTMEGARAIRDRPGYRARGRAVVDVLAALPTSPLRRLLAAGHLAGLWGPPLWWDGAVLRPLAFRPAERGADGVSSASAIRSTNLGRGPPAAPG